MCNITIMCNIIISCAILPYSCSFCCSLLLILLQHICNTSLALFNPLSLFIAVSAILFFIFICYLHFYIYHIQYHTPWLCLFTSAETTNTVTDSRPANAHNQLLCPTHLVYFCTYFIYLFILFYRFLLLLNVCVALCPPNCPLGMNNVFSDSDHCKM